MQYAKILIEDITNKTNNSIKTFVEHRNLYVMDNDIGKLILSVDFKYIFKKEQSEFSFLTPSGNLKKSGREGVDLMDSCFKIIDDELHASQIIKDIKSTHEALKNTEFQLYKITRENASDGVVKCVYHTTVTA